MLYHGQYEVDPAFVRDGNIKWEVTGCGTYIIGTKGGRKFFIKRNSNISFPDPSLPEEARMVYKAQADRIVNKQARLRSLMSGLTWDNDGIVAEEDNFWDEDSRFTTVTACIPNKLPDNHDFSSLSKAEFLDLAKKAAKALKLLHSRGVIHGDLKEKNLIVGKKGSSLQPYLIDFDSSYPADEIPPYDCIGGTEGYRSPEILVYECSEGESGAETITYATDVFTLGLIFHRWWTGSFPDITTDSDSVAVAVYSDEKINLNNKFDTIIGDKSGATFISLINWMLAKEPSDRPTAEQVLDVLEDKKAVPVAYHVGSDVQPIKLELWNQHKNLLTLKTLDELTAMGVVGFEKVNSGGAHKYSVTLGSGEESKLTVEELIAAGYATRAALLIDAPWPEHEITFESEDVIFSKGFASIKTTTTFFGKKRYNVTYVSGMSTDVGVEWLIREGVARVKLPDPVEIDADTPWPEHASEYNHERMAKRGVVKISRVDLAGDHRYNIEYGANSSGGARIVEGVYAKNLELLGFFK